MRFLLEVVNKGTLLSTKETLEQELGTKYDSLNTIERVEFIGKVLDKLPNHTKLANAHTSIQQALSDSNWSNSFFNEFIETQQHNLTDSVVSLIYELISKNKIDSNNSNWLFDDDLFNRDESDTIYTIKALVLASNDNLQKSNDGENKFFDENNPLTVDDLYENGRLATAARIEDIINAKQTKEVKYTQNSKNFVVDKMNAIAKNNKVEINAAQQLNAVDLQVKQELVDMLKSLGVKTQDAQTRVDTVFKQGMSTEDLILPLIQGLND